MPPFRIVAEDGELYQIGGLYDAREDAVEALEEARTVVDTRAAHPSAPSPQTDRLKADTSALLADHLAYRELWVQELKEGDETSSWERV